MDGLVVLADLIAMALGMIFGAFCIWLIVQFVNRPERLRSWMKDSLYQSVRRALSVIIVAGVAAICTVCLLLRAQSLSFTLFTRVYMTNIALTALPTDFFVAAFLMSSTSARMQRAIARTAGCFGIVAVGVALAELSRDSLIEMQDWYPFFFGFFC
jgi:hypothetical protein